MFPRIPESCLIPERMKQNVLHYFRDRGRAGLKKKAEGFVVSLLSWAIVVFVPTKTRGGGRLDPLRAEVRVEAGNVTPHLWRSQGKRPGPPLVFLIGFVSWRQSKATIEQNNNHQPAAS
jgi:hypothetical protein